MDNETEKKPEISPQKLEANRRNAKKSTGPRTTSGKQHSSRNSTKHGILCKGLVVADRESGEEFDQHLQELVEHYQPQNRSALSLVETVAICDWRFRRSLFAEQNEIAGTLPSDPMAFGRVLPSADELTKILRYQTAIHRQKMQALQLLEKLQQRRRNPPSTSADNGSDAEEK
jgi:hypothetical protein